jgi:hypothetical protein
MRRRRGLIWVIWKSPVWEGAATPNPLRQQANYANLASRAAIAASFNPKPSIRQNSVIANLARAETGPESFVPQLLVADKSRLFAFDVSEVDFIPLAITMAYFAQA